MSKSTNQKKTFWKAVQIDSGPEHPKRKNTIALIKRLYTALLCDSLCLDPIANRCDRQKCMKICSIVSRASLAGLQKLSDELRSLVTLFDHKYETRQWLPDRTEWFPSSNFADCTFKQYYSSILEPACFQLICQMKPLVKAFCAHPIGATARPLNNLACFLTRANIVRDDLKWELAEDFKSRDEKLGSTYHRSDTVRDSLIDTMREVVTEWFSDFKLVDLIPHHGPGATAELPAKLAYIGNKYATLGLDERLRNWLNSYVNNWRDFYPLPELLLPSWERCSKLVFVPKSLKTMRAINKIPTTLMYWQQAVKDSLYRFMADSRQLHAVIQLEDSSTNAYLALNGSRQGTFGTIDLSSASDSVSYALVKRIFADVPPLIDAFEALRCDSCELEIAKGKFVRFKPEKFAPMGEPLCFPVECIVFASCIEATLRQKDVNRCVTHEYYNVYGDDMVVRSEFCLDCIASLELLGFTVNESKSFCDPASAFRESCGVEAYLGEDITPIRVPRSLVHPADLDYNTLKATQVRHLKGFKTNSLDVSCAYHASLFLEQLRPIWNYAVESALTNVKLAILAHIDPSVVWWADDPAVGWLTTDADNYRLTTAMDLTEDYQRPYSYTTAFVAVDWKDTVHKVVSRYGVETLVTDDTFRYFHWFAEANRRDFTKSLFSDTSRITTRPPAISARLIGRPLCD